MNKTLIKVVAILMGLMILTVMASILPISAQGESTVPPEDLIPTCGTPHFHAFDIKMANQLGIRNGRELLNRRAIEGVRTAAITYTVGMTETFHVQDAWRTHNGIDDDGDGLVDWKSPDWADFDEAMYEITARVEREGSHCYVFVEEGQGVSDKDLDYIKDQFDNKVYDKDVDTFGTQPDVDDNRKIVILLMDIRDDRYYGIGQEYIAGYFWSLHEYLNDELSPPEKGFSNERDMIHVDVSPGQEGESGPILAHEFQHMIHWNHDADEETWVDEGCADYAMFACGYGHPWGHVHAFENNPDTMLPISRWPITNTLPNYGASYLFTLYLSEKYPGDVSPLVRDLVAENANGIEGISKTLENNGYTERFEDVFHTWVIANYLDDDSIDSRYKYDSIDVGVRTWDPWLVPVGGQPYTIGGGQNEPSPVSAWASDYDKANFLSFGFYLKTNFQGDGDSQFAPYAVHKNDLDAINLIKSDGNWHGVLFTHIPSWYDNVVYIVPRKGGGGTGEYKLDLVEVGGIPTQVNILAPTQAAPKNVGPHDDPIKVSIEVKIETSDGKFIPGLTKKYDYIVKIGGKTGTILNVVEKSDRYVLMIMPPKQDTGGEYDLDVTFASLTDSETNAINYGERNVDVVLIIDSSGSMSWNDPGGFRKTAADYFVDLANIGDTIGIADFGHSDCYSRLLHQLLELTGEGDRDVLKLAIDQVLDGGSTPIGYGLRQGYNELSSPRAVAGHSKAGILLTDGFDTCGTRNLARDYATNFGSEGWFLYTIGLTGDADEALLQELATLGKGSYYKAPTNEQLLEIYSAISGRVIGESTLITARGTIQQGATGVQTALVDSSVAKAKFMVSWSGSDLDLTLERPDGSIIDPATAATDPTIDYITTPSYEFYTISSPMPGEWKLNILGKDVTGSESYVASAVGITTLTVDMYFDRGQYSIGEPIKINASLSGPTYPITGATVIANIQLPSGTTLRAQTLAGKDLLTEEEKTELANLRKLQNLSLQDQITLFDDGLHGDGMANEGVYSNFYLNTSTAGSYEFLVKASGSVGGEPFTREMQETTFVSGGPLGELSVEPSAWDIPAVMSGESITETFAISSTVDTIVSIYATDLTASPASIISPTNFFIHPSVFPISAGECRIFTATLAIPSDTPSGAYAGSILVSSDIGAIPVLTTVEVMAPATILTLNQEWNLISFNREPADTNTSSVLAPIDGLYSVVLGYDQGGLSYYPDIPEELNTLRDMDPYHGYWIKTTTAATLPIIGTKVAVDTPLSLDTWWNLVSYLPDSPQPLTAALASIEGQYEAVLGYDQGALSYYPHLPEHINTLHTLEPKHGYWIKMKQAGTLIYPSASVSALGRTAAGAHVNTPQAAAGVTPTNEWVDFYSFNTRVNGQPVPEGSIVTAYDPDGVKIGECVIEQPGSFGLLSAYGDDVLTPEDEGAEPGDTITFYINGYRTTAIGPDEPIWISFGDLSNVDLAVTYHSGYRVYLPLILK